MSAFTEGCDVPQSKLEAWEEMDAKTLKLYDIGRAVAWDIHEKVKEGVYQSLQTAGFRQVRDLGVVLRV